MKLLKLSALSEGRWNRMSPSQRRELSQAILRGERVSDAADALLAAELAAQKATGEIVSSTIATIFVAAAMFAALGPASLRAWITAVLFSMVVWPVAFAKRRRLVRAQKVNCPT